jgi:hypothetical protein
MSRSPALFSGPGPVGLPPVPWIDKTIGREVGRAKDLSAPDKTKRFGSSLCFLLQIGEKTYQMDPTERVILSKIWIRKQRLLSKNIWITLRKNRVQRKRRLFRNTTLDRKNSVGSKWMLRLTTLFKKMCHIEQVGKMPEGSVGFIHSYFGPVS